MTIVLGIDTGGTYTDALHALGYFHEWHAGVANAVGASHVHVQVIRKEKKAKAKGDREVYLETELTFMALGRPSMAVKQLAISNKR